MEEIFIGTTDRFGYYQVGHQKIYSKYDAIKLHEKTGIHPEWHFHDEIFSCYNWRQEPTESLTELYRRRAEQLREKYDYIVLFFSGGADSTTVLDSFINNNIHLDEIVSFHHYLGNQNRFTHTDAEVTNVAIPRAQRALERSPNTKFSLIDLSTYIYDFYKSNRNIDYYLQNMITINGRPDTVKYKAYELEPTFLDLIHSGRRVCFLTGQDKPRIHKIGDKWTFKFIDMLTVCNGGANTPVEYFYWSADLPELIIKQAHTVKRYLELADASTPFVTTKPKGGNCSKEHNGQTLYLTNHGVHSLIYPSWDIETFTVAKAVSLIYGEKTKWMQFDQLDPVSVIWRKIIDSWWKSVPDYWKNDPTDIHKGIKGMWSKSYELN